MSKASVKKVLDQYQDTASFLQDLIGVLEELYADDPEGCPEGFSALDQAVAAFGESES